MQLPGGGEAFKQRLLKVAAGRKLTPWLMSLGWTRTDVARVNRGHIPGPEKLALLVDTENVSLSWLLAGKGDPWIGDSPPGVRETAAAYDVLTPSKRELLEQLRQSDDSAAAAVVALLKALKKARD